MAGRYYSDEEVRQAGHSFPLLDSAHPYQLGNGEGSVYMLRPLPHRVDQATGSTSTASADDSKSRSKPFSQQRTQRLSTAPNATSDNTGSAPGPSSKSMGKRKAVDPSEDEPSASRQDHRGGSSDSDDGPFVLGGIGDFLRRENEARALQPPPPPKNYGRIPVNFYQPARGQYIARDDVFPQEAFARWNAYTLYNTATKFNQYTYQECERDSTRVLMYSAPVAFKHMTEFNERQNRLQQGIRQYTDYIRSCVAIRAGSFCQKYGTFLPLLHN